MRAPTLLLGILMVLPGCKLIDQNTFNPDASKVPAPPTAPVVAATAPIPPGPRPLLTILPPGDYRDAVRQAVSAARSRKPDVVFDVVAVTPLGSDVVSEDAGAVARAIVAQGVPPTRVRLSARPEAGSAGREVRVFVH